MDSKMSNSQGTTLPPPRKSNAARRPYPARRKPAPPPESVTSSSKPSSPSSNAVNVERTVKKLRLTKALTIPEGTMVSDACRRMAARRVDAVLLTDSNALLSGIVTDKDIATRVTAEELKPDQTTLAKVMTRNPIFVTSETLAIEALQKMVQGKFRHLPVVENGEVIALLDITKCLYDAISGMERVVDQFDGVEQQLGSNFNTSSMHIETLQERFKPSLSTIITENTKVSTVAPSDTVCHAAKKMRDSRGNSIVIMSDNKVQGILTSRDILMRVVAQNLAPEVTSVEKVMTSSPECATMDTTILEALQIMRDGKFLHLPVLDKDGSLVACVDVLQLTHAAVSMVESNSGSPSEMANATMQKFWDSALSMEPADESETRSEMSASMMASEAANLGKCSSIGLGNSFPFKFKDSKGRVHRFVCSNDNMDELMSTVVQRIGVSNSERQPQLYYKDDENDKVTLTCDVDLVAAVLHAKSIGAKVLRLYVELPQPVEETNSTQITRSTPIVENSRWTSIHSRVLDGAVVLTGVAVMVYLKRANVSIAQSLNRFKPA